MKTFAARWASSWRLVQHALAFVLGFSLVFVIGWGGAATALGQLFAAYKGLLARIGGVVVILFGFHTLGWITLPLLAYDIRPSLRTTPQGLLGSTMLGVFFAAGWTPCIGTTLGAILTLGMSQATASQAMVLAGAYALGLGVPFLLLSLGVDWSAALVQRFGRHVQRIQTASGVLLVAIGLLLLSNRLTWIAIWAQRNGLFLDLPLGTTSVPNLFLAFSAGLLSFLSPCVLPLVPAYLGYLSQQALAPASSS